MLTLTPKRFSITLTDEGSSVDLVAEQHRVRLTVATAPLSLVAQAPDALRVTLVPALKGDKGDPGEDGDKHYRHVQSTPEASWVIDHNLGKFPAVSVVDSGGTEVEGNVQYPSQHRVIVSFTAAFAGEAYLN